MTHHASFAHCLDYALSAPLVKTVHFPISDLQRLIRLQNGLWQEYMDPKRGKTPSRASRPDPAELSMHRAPCLCTRDGPHHDESCQLLEQRKGTRRRRWTLPTSGLIVFMGRVVDAETGWANLFSHEKGRARQVRRRALLHSVLSHPLETAREFGAGCKNSVSWYFRWRVPNGLMGEEDGDGKHQRWGRSCYGLNYQLTARKPIN